MAKRPFVALLIETSNSYARGLLRRIHAYLREHRPWSIYLPEAGRSDIPPTWLASWGGDGIIARIENKRIARIVHECHAPIVDLSAGRFVPELPCVETDNQEIARLAFEHLYERGSAASPIAATIVLPGPSIADSGFLNLQTKWNALARFFGRGDGDAPRHRGSMKTKT
jgi:DNA-binding LacI/PurR family transcriptional regulator